ncbi:MAG: hypothetical protein OXN81_06295 [Alphaproteobacteria bacterium]|nr:hypothetical protein [Alphaproteobacteria bacterium]
MDGRNAEKRRQHAIMVTDSEWRRLTERAKAAGMPVSRFIVHRLAEADSGPPPDRGPGGLPAPVWRRVAREVLLLGRLEEERLAGQRLSEERAALAVEVDDWLARQEELA